MQESDNGQWTVSATDALEVSLVRSGPNGLETIASFNPKFTYALFEDERIFGYQDLNIKLQYNASDMRPHLSISSKKKFTPVGDIEAVDVKTIMKEFLPNAAFQSKSEFTEFVKQLPENWTPPGQLLKTCEKNGATYEVWQGSLADPTVRQLLKRIQISVLFFIEGGSYIGEDAEGNDDSEESLARWTVYFLYKKGAQTDGNPQYIFQGYATVHNFWLYQQPTPPGSPTQAGEAGASIEDCSKSEDSLSVSKMPHRARISQFVILPPFQGMGGGALLYDTIFSRHIEDSFTKEVTVEDPNEEFDLLRDLCDMKWLRNNKPDFVKLEVNPAVVIPAKGGILRNNTQVSLSEDDSAAAADGIVDVDALGKMRRDAKIAPRQFSRLVEMHLMAKLPATVRPNLDAPDEGSSKSVASLADKQAYTRWRLLLKQRIYRRNASLLAEFETTERIIKLNETLESVEWEYAGILDRLDSMPSTIKAAEAAGLLGGKRKLEDDEDDSDDGGARSAKKPKASNGA